MLDVRSEPPTRVSVLAMLKRLFVSPLELLPLGWRVCSLLLWSCLCSLTSFFRGRM